VGETVEMFPNKVTIKNRQLAGQLFWTSFNRVMTLTDIPVEDKLALVKLKGQLITEVEAVKEVVTNCTDEDFNAVMDKDNTFNFKPVDVPLEKLTAEEMFQLKGFIKE
jgi:hypothetical protein